MYVTHHCFRFALKRAQSHNKAEMLKELSLLPVIKRLKYYGTVFTYNAMNNLTSQYITDLLKPVAENHNRALRSSVDGALAIPMSRSSLFDRSISIFFAYLSYRFLTYKLSDIYSRGNKLSVVGTINCMNSFKAVVVGEGIRKSHFIKLCLTSQCCFCCTKLLHTYVPYV